MAEIIKDYPADLTMPDGTTHRLWLDENGNLLSVENNTISLITALTEMERIWTENEVSYDD